MIGTLVNVTAIMAGSTIGSLLKKGISDKFQTVMFQSMGLAATGLGIANIAKAMPGSKYPVLFIISLAIGGIVGTYFSLDTKSEKFIAKLGKNLSEGLTTAVLLFCIGSLSILGPIESALHGNHTLLFTNATLDFVTSMVLASTYGIGIIYAAFVLFLWQGSIYLCAGFAAPFLKGDLMTELSIIGGILILGTGLNILKAVKIKIINLIPAIFVPMLFFLVKEIIKWIIH